MLQRLLEDRFALKLRSETRIGDVLTLVLDRTDGTVGPKVKKWDADDPHLTYCPSGFRRGGWTVCVYATDQREPRRRSWRADRG